MIFKNILVKNSNLKKKKMCTYKIFKYVKIFNIFLENK